MDQLSSGCQRSPSSGPLSQQWESLVDFIAFFVRIGLRRDQGINAGLRQE